MTGSDQRTGTAEASVGRTWVTPCCLAGAEAVCMGEVFPGEDSGHPQQGAGGAEEGCLSECM